MLFSHVVYAVESYRVASDRPGAFGDEVVVEGWFLSHAEILSMSVRFGDGTSFEVQDRRRQSDVVHAHYGQMFGEAARACRFLLVEPVGMRRLEPGSAMFRVELVNGQIMNWALGPILTTRESEFTAADSALVMSFESIGDNCEFGLVQRMIGQERLSFLRYAGVGDVLKLAAGIADGFSQVDGPGSLQILQAGGEWIAKIPPLDLVFHTGRSVESMSLERIREEEGRKLAFMAQRFVEDCEDAEKIFVYRVLPGDRGGADGAHGMDELYAALRRHGPCRLLWVNEEDAAHPHRTVEHVREGLYRGYIDHLAPLSNAFDHRPQSWLALLAAARDRID